jgi:hypothetical protein
LSKSVGFVAFEGIKVTVDVDGDGRQIADDPKHPDYDGQNAFQPEANPTTSKFTTTTPAL